MQLVLCFLANAPAEGGGFNPIDLSAGGNLFWTLAVFAVSVPLIWMVVMGPVTKALAERDEKTERAIAAAEKAGQDAEEARVKVEATLKEASATAARALAEARARAETRGQELIEAAKAEAGTLLEGARRAIRAEQDKALATIRGEVVELSLRAASKVLERNVGSEDDRRFATQIVSGVREGVGRG